MIFQYLRQWKGYSGLVFFKTLFANNDEEEDNMDRECQIKKKLKNESSASNLVFQCSHWQYVTRLL